MSAHSHGRLAVVTGAGSGIGKAVALAFAARRRPGRCRQVISVSGGLTMAG
jgi:NAD(P)-dependent dehydrogenase (short-subunit alcohol dehydrogenase family)